MAVFHLTRGVKGAVGVPVCAECQSIGADGYFLTPEQKRQFIRTKLMSRHGQYLNVADWGSDEVSSLGYTLRTSVVAGVNEKHRLQQRLLWPRQRPKPARG